MSLTVLLASPTGSSAVRPTVRVGRALRSRVGPRGADSRLRHTCSAPCRGGLLEDAEIDPRAAITTGALPARPCSGINVTGSRSHHLSTRAAQPHPRSALTTAPASRHGQPGCRRGSPGRGIWTNSRPSRPPCPQAAQGASRELRPLRRPPTAAAPRHGPTPGPLARSWHDGVALLKLRRFSC
jgi:hypothetical protein